jgi:hypothetical protein
MSCRQIQRSPRIASRLHQFGHFARCSIPGHSALYQTGDYDDISESGMIMVSRAKNRLPTGALVTVEFKLRGIETIFSRRARVARTAGDFELGLAFSALLILAGMGLVAYLGSDLHAKLQPKYHWGKS